MARKTKAEALETRHQLLDAAMRVFRERGVARTTLQDVAGAAGMTRGAVYWHFKDKPDLFNAMMDRVVLPWEEAHEALVASAPDDPLHTLALIAIDPLERLQRSPDIQQVFLIAMHYTEYTDELASVRSHQRECVATYIAEMETLFARAAERGELLPGVPARAAATGLFGLVDGLMRHWVQEPQAFELEATGRLAVRAYLAGLSRNSGQPSRTPAG